MNKKILVLSVAAAMLMIACSPHASTTTSSSSLSMTTTSETTSSTSTTTTIDSTPTIDDFKMAIIDSKNATSYKTVKNVYSPSYSSEGKFNLNRITVDATLYDDGFYYAASSNDTLNDVELNGDGEVASSISNVDNIYVKEGKFYQLNLVDNPYGKSVSGYVVNEDYFHNADAIKKGLATLLSKPSNAFLDDGIDVSLLFDNFNDDMTISKTSNIVENIDGSYSYSFVLKCEQYHFYGPSDLYFDVIIDANHTLISYGYGYKSYADLETQEVVSSSYSLTSNFSFDSKGSYSGETIPTESSEDISVYITTTPDPYDMSNIQEHIDNEGNVPAEIYNQLKNSIGYYASLANGYVEYEITQDSYMGNSSSYETGSLNNDKSVNTIQGFLTKEIKMNDSNYNQYDFGEMSESYVKTITRLDDCIEKSLVGSDSIIPVIEDSKETINFVRESNGVLSFDCFNSEASAMEYNPVITLANNLTYSNVSSCTVKKDYGGNFESIVLVISTWSGDYNITLGINEVKSVALSSATQSYWCSLSY